MRPFWKSAALRSLVATVAAAVALSAQASPLRLVSTAWPPFTNEPGQPRFALDLVEGALSRIKLSAQTTIVEAARYTPDLLGGAFDGSAAAWKDAERERVLVFSQAYLENRLVLVGRQGADVTAAAIADLKGARVAIVEGYAYGDAIAQSKATLVRSRSEEDSLALLLAGKTDYLLMDELVVQYIVDNYPNEVRTKLSLGSKPLLTRSLHFAVKRSRPDAQSIIDRFNAQLRGMIADRTYHRLLHVAWIRADVDGDGVAELVPRSDWLGSAAPSAAYTLYASDQASAPPAGTSARFYAGGTVYGDWATVPNRYKAEDPNPLKPDVTRSGGPIFKFTW